MEAGSNSCEGCRVAPFMAFSHKFSSGLVQNTYPLPVCITSNPIRQIRLNCRCAPQRGGSTLRSWQAPPASRTARRKRSTAEQHASRKASDHHVYEANLRQRWEDRVMDAWLCTTLGNRLSIFESIEREILSCFHQRVISPSTNARRSIAEKASNSPRFQNLSHDGSWSIVAARQALA